MCFPKDTIKKGKRSPTEWKKIFANNLPHRSLYPQYIYLKKLLQLNNKRANIPIKTMSKQFEDIPIKKELQMGNIHIQV